MSNVVQRMTSWVTGILVSCVGWSYAAAAAPPPRSVLPVKNADAKSEGEMKPYTEVIEHAEVTFDLVPIRGGTFLMGSPETEKDRAKDEGPQRKVKVDPFWMGKCEVTWDEFEVWMFDMDIERRKLKGVAANERDKAADEYQLTQPTAPYADMTFGMGREGFPAICMTQFGARVYCMWLTEKTGRYYRLPTEAEWEYACRAGTTTAYFCGDDPKKLEEYAWTYENSDEAYHKVGKKKPNPWGLHDMHGNVAEWVLDGYTPGLYLGIKDELMVNPLVPPTKIYPRVVRGGSWDDDAKVARSAARGKSTPEWSAQDPQIPQSIWYHTDALQTGFRVVRPLVEPSAQERAEKWDKQLPVQERKKKL